MAMAHGLVPQSQDSTFGSQSVVDVGTCQYRDCSALEQEHHTAFHEDEASSLKIEPGKTRKAQVNFKALATE